MNPLDPVNFYFNLPMYTPIIITEENDNDFNNLLYSSEGFNGYSPTLKENSTFKNMSEYNNEYFYNYGGVTKITLRCLRTNENFYIFLHYDTEQHRFQKIGQYPSIASFHINQIKKYKKVLDEDLLKEFTRAIGLAANGVGIGSFVYLRRIFEQLIENAHIIAKGDACWNAEAYKSERMVKKIELLKSHLPAFLFENKNLYGILSIGIHSLKEEECLLYFDTVKLGIELILDEKVEQFNKQKKIKEATSKLNLLTNKIQKS